ncbi:MAG TPA: CopG family antitoxin [Thermoanaerobaculia bacterium]|nr:CopG family antitoxin [Thermoanaerobaculia bacterium]
MPRNNQREPIPEQFSSIQEAGEFWDTHDLTDYEDQTREADFEVDLRRRVFLTALEPELAKKVAAYAHRQGISTETLVNLWLGEKLAAATSGG